jgi:hypothetical protein
MSDAAQVQMFYASAPCCPARIAIYQSTRRDTPEGLILQYDIACILFWGGGALARRL